MFAMDSPVYNAKKSVPGKFLVFTTEEQFVADISKPSNCNEVIIIIPYVTGFARLGNQVMIEIYGESYTKFIFKGVSQAEAFLEYIRDHLAMFYGK